MTILEPVFLTPARREAAEGPASDKARDPQAGAPGPRKRTVWYVEEARGTRLRVAQRSHRGALRHCSGYFMHKPG